ncbi:bifunctional DNA primase/polymerase [Atopobiaceae bacterium LCP21S3_F11]
MTLAPPTIADLEQQLADAVRLERWLEAEQIGAHLDRLCADPPPPGLVDAALWYAALGVPVFPLEPGGKRPYRGSHGCKDAVTDPAQIRAWWTAAPASNIGIATGHVVDVIDLDGAAGVKSWAGDMWEALPPIVGRARTRRPGGWHLYTPATGMGNRASMFPGVDYRGQGGYVVAPPSIVDGVTYRWTDPLEVGR